MASKKKVAPKKTVKKKIATKKKVANTIYIQIAAYRDPELLNTINDCINNAKYPKNLRFGIAWQHSPHEAWDNLDPYINDKRFRIIDIDYRDAKGPCHARYLLNKGYENETYMMQLDSHHRFVEHWDDILINMVENLRKEGYKKPLLSSYLPSYDPTNDPDGRSPSPWIMEFDRFAPEGPVHFLPHTIDEWKELDKPVRSRFISGHFIFADGKFCREVEYNPNYYFHGEEIDLSARAFMAGYDLFAPHRTVAWHEYTREGKKKHWDDNPIWIELDKASHKQHRERYGIDGIEADTKLVKNVRTLRDYEIYAGLEFKTRRVHIKTIEKVRPPVSLTSKKHDAGLQYYQRHCIDIYKPSVPETDYDFWVIAFEDEHGVEFYRQDADANEVKNILSIPFEKDKFAHVWRNFNSNSQARRWIVWPHSVSKGWCERMTGMLGKPE